MNISFINAFCSLLLLALTMACCKLFLRKVLVIAGATLITSPVSMLTYYGNVLPYLASYFQTHRDSMTYHLSALWPSTAYRTCLPLAMIFASPLERRLGIRTCIACGQILISISVLSGFYAIQEPLALTLVFGAVQGMSNGISYSLTNKLLLASVPGKGGLITGIVSIGPALGSLVNIGLAYAVVNPNNAKADLLVGNTLYFSDPNILERVPYYFLVTGAFTTIMTISGMILLFMGSANLFKEESNEHISGSTESDEEILSGDKSTAEVSDHFRGCDSRSNLVEHCKPAYGCSIASPSSGLQQFAFNEGTESISSSRSFRKVSDNKALIPNKTTFSVETSCPHSTTKRDIVRDGAAPRSTDRDSVAGESMASYHSDIRIEQENNQSAFSSACDLTPWDTVRTGRFWCVWVSYLGLGHTLYVQTNLYKQYGQLVISSDVTLVIAGLLSTAFMAITRPSVGAFSDRHSVPTSLVAVCFISSLFMNLMVVAAHTSAVFYIMASMVEFAGVSSLILVFNLLVASMFGKSHFASNMGLVYSAMIANVTVEPVIVSWIIGQFGWDWVFLSGSAASSLAMVVAMLL